MSIPGEERAYGGVSFSTYYQYFKTGGGYLFTLFVFVFLFAVEVSYSKYRDWVGQLLLGSCTVGGCCDG